MFSYREVESRVWTKARAVLIGDAAHAMNPLLGLGAQFAIEDARLLANEIAACDDPKGAIQSIAKARAAQLRSYQSVSRWLTPLFHSDQKILAMVRDKLLARSLNNPLAKKMVSEFLI